ncbi:DUF1149 family protein [Bombilactobacillus thymidiniphilus]|uniref:DUF1149 family protein n=1 Tax=Bombilactobacillus thymidiniphilus TaxID=2923363 RepID=A0ABY4PCQ6_9LACO|nr:DUF1149 family protein [Bombilactobacillus thymidiniphilus]UQS83286.1 DUF1149 family protein [Bombilactobacillus thymidiniphilus]
MQVASGPIIMQSYHYDLVEADSEAKTDIQVQIQNYEVEDENVSGTMIQLLIPFDVHPENVGFAISGLVGQVIQLTDFTGEISDLTGEQVEQLSRPLITEIQSLTYQVTALTLDHGYNLDFQANTN